MAIDVRTAVIHRSITQTYRTEVLGKHYRTGKSCHSKSSLKWLKKYLRYSEKPGIVGVRSARNIPAFRTTTPCKVAASTAANWSFDHRANVVFLTRKPI
jgi:hypothetical protein